MTSPDWTVETSRSMLIGLFLAIVTSGWFHWTSIKTLGQTSEHSEASTGNAHKYPHFVPLAGSFHQPICLLVHRAVNHIPILPWELRWQAERYPQRKRWCFWGEYCCELLVTTTDVQEFSWCLSNWRMLLLSCVDLSKSTSLSVRTICWGNRAEEKETAVSEGVWIGGRSG